MEKIKQMMNQPIRRQTVIKCLFILVTILFALPSFIYLIRHQSIHRFLAIFTYFLELPKKGKEIDLLLNTIFFIGLFSALFVLYIKILKQHHTMFKNIKRIFLFILVVSLLFVIVIPITSLDSYSYIGHGWLASHYHENPYYTTIQERIDSQGIHDEMFDKVALGWRNESTVYGPLWTMICTILSSLSMGSVDLALLLFKLFNLLIHLVNCVLIYQFTKKKKVWVLLYGLNPFILFEFLSNVHNDILIIFFVFLGIYFLKNKKSLPLAVVAIAMATAVKYFTILLLPFLVLYGVRNKKIGNKIGYCLLYGLEFIGVLALFYAIYIRDLQIFAGLFIQQEKVNTSILYLIYFFTGKNKNVLEVTKIIFMVTFFVCYTYTIVKLLLAKENRWPIMMRKYNKILLFFIFLLITNFRPWYIIWLFPTIFWQRTNSIRTIQYLAYASQIANGYTYLMYIEDEVKIGIPFILTVLLLPVIFHGVRIRTNKIIEEKRRKQI